MWTQNDHSLQVCPHLIDLNIIQYQRIVKIYRHQPSEVNGIE